MIEPLMHAPSPFMPQPPAGTKVQAEAFNTAELDLGYEVAFPFLTSDDESYAN